MGRKKKEEAPETIKEVTVVRRFKMTEKICPVCGKKFQGTKKKTYCSIACQQKRNYERHAERYRKARMDRYNKERKPQDPKSSLPLAA